MNASQYSFEVGSDGFWSPGSSMFGNFLPYGINTPTKERSRKIVRKTIENCIKIIQNFFMIFKTFRKVLMDFLNCK